MTRNRVIQLVALFIAVGCLAGAAALSGPIHDERVSLQLSPTLTNNKAIPPGIMLTQAALGSFRGLAVDFLWYRANQLKEAGQFAEANQLSETICALQPRFPRVWVFHAWNMAYNISVATHTPEERWNWVNKGVQLLRDSGIPANPDSVLLKKELSWIFFHKMGGVSDDMHWYYRSKLAHEWQELLGSPEGMTTEQAIQRIQDIVDAPAPDQLDELRKDEAVNRLLTTLTEWGYQPDKPLLVGIGRVLMFTLSEDRSMVRWSQERVLRFLDPRLGELMNTPEMVPAFQKFVPWLRKKVLLENYHMDPAEMLRMMQTFGPMDWRHPAAHGAYWAQQGINSAEKALDENKKDIDQLNTDRLIIHSFQALTHTGRLTFDPISGFIDIMPDPRFIKAYEKALLLARDRIDVFGGDTKEGFDSGYENFMVQEGIMISYFYGDVQQAEEYYNRWREMFGAREHNHLRATMSLEDLVWDEWKNFGSNRDNVRAFIDAQIRQAFIQGLAQGRGDVFQQFMRMAKRAYDEHNDRKVENPNSEQGRLHLPPWEELVNMTFASIIKDRRMRLITRSRVWVRVSMLAPSAVQAAYDQVRDSVFEEALAEGYDPQAILPEPPGMAEYRQRREQQTPAKLPGFLPPEPPNVQVR